MHQHVEGIGAQIAEQKQRDAQMRDDEAQQQQLIQINQLESEVRDLRRLATDRSKNRKYILQERFRTLTGEDWPEDK